MGDRLRAGNPSRYVTSHLGQLSLTSLAPLRDAGTGVSVDTPRVMKGYEWVSLTPVK